MYSLFMLFLCIPLIFSHAFARFGADFVIDNGIGNFESIKMYLFFVLLIITTIEMCMFRWEKFNEKGARFWGYVGIGTLITSLLSWFSYDEVNIRNFLFGVGEKQHGFLLFIGIFWLSILLTFLEKREKKILSFALIASGVLVSIFAIIESLGYNFFTGAHYSLTGSWGDIRSTSTLGNPNYVAGFLLMILPLILRNIQRGERYVLIFIVLLGILTTKSIIGISIGGIYMLSLLGKRFFGEKTYTILPLFLVVGGLVIFGLFYESEKWLSLTSRFILMKHTVLIGLESVWGTLLGHGPDAIMHFFSGIRPTEINAYFPENMIIDSSHNIFIDIWGVSGIIGLAATIWYIVCRWRCLDSYSRYGILIGCTFLSLNVFVISHLMVLAYFFSLENEKTPNKSKV